MRLAQSGEIKGVGKGYIIPIFAIIGSLVIISGSITHPLFVYYFLICASIIVAGGVFYGKNKANIT